MADAAPVKVAKAKKPKAPASHPPVAEMVTTAIKTLKDRKGSSLQAIKKYIADNYKVDMVRISPHIKKFLKGAVESGKLVQPKGKGASGSFKLGAAAKAEKPKKKPAAKKATKPKADKSAKKPAPKKAKTPKKAAKPKKEKTPKKAAKPKKTKTPKKAKVAKSPKKVKAAKPKAAKPKAAKPKAKKAAKK